MDLLIYLKKLFNRIIKKPGCWIFTGVWRLWQFILKIFKNKKDDVLPLSQEQTLGYDTLDNDDSITTISANDFKHLLNKSREKMLTKYGITIFRSDYHTLDDWLSDAIVNFAAMHLYEELTVENKNKVNIINSNACDIIKYDPTPKMFNIFNELNITNEKWQFFVYNDNSNFGYQSGSHWSLIVYNTNDTKFYLVDSLKNNGVSYGIQQFANKVMQGMNITPHTVQCVKCPKMEEIGDCGIYLIEHLRSILNNFNTDWTNFDNMQTKAKILRQEWKKIIRNNDGYKKTTECFTKDLAAVV